MFRGNPSIRAGEGNWAGFTLVELLVVLAVAAILVTIASPALQNLIASNQLNAVTDSFAASLNEARSEAGKYGVPVAFTTLGGVNWGSGWTMFVDGSDLNGVQDAGATPPEVTLRTGSVPVSYAMTANGAFAGQFWFDATGHLLDNTGNQPAASAQFKICGPPAGGGARLITVSASGRVRIAQNNSSGQPLDDSGNPVTCP